MNIKPMNGGHILQIKSLTDFNNHILFSKTNNTNVVTIIQTHLRKDIIKYRTLLQYNNINKITEHYTVTSCKSLLKVFKVLYKKYFFETNNQNNISGFQVNNIVILDSIDSLILDHKMVRTLNAFKFVGFKVVLLSKMEKNYWFVDEMIESE
ncbi:hypothetical protein CDIK_1663 [Cucumispora dikerogammari]|nr:hypothetical protein CDIK_1663 [Cucumispora dikerogammari]